MKFAYLSMLILLLSCSMSHAAFVVQPIQRTAEASSTTIAAKRTNPLIRMGSSAVPAVKQFFHTHGDRHYHENNETDAILALIFGIVGIFIWPLGIAALILGIKGSYRGNTYSSLGVIGLILGALEIAAMLAVVIFFIVLLAMI